MWRNSGLLLPALLVAGCDASINDREQRSGDVMVADPAATGEDASAALEVVVAPMAWRVVDGAAYFGAADQPPVFAMRCDRARQEVLFERPGGGETLILTAGGVEASLEATPTDGGRVQARTGLDNPVLDGMTRSQSPIRIGGGAETVTAPGGVAIRRILDECRAPEPEPTPETLPGPIVIPPVITEPAPFPPDR